MTNFEGLQLAQPILHAIADEGYTTPSPIQAKSIPPLLEGRDLLGVAQTGTGKTAAFALPLLHRLSKHAVKSRPNQPHALILAPTRELAGQIGDSLRTYARHLGLRSRVIFGGVSARPQIKVLNQGVHILVATPGRLLDLMNQRHVRLDGIEIFVLDEADRMLDMGFIRDVKKIEAALPKRRQTTLFSATMPKSVEGLAASLLNDPVRVEVAPAATTAEKVKQSVLFVPKDKKRALLSELLKDKSMERVLIFTRTKHGADKVARHLQQKGVSSDAIHGNKAQNARQRALNGFRAGNTRVLVATDIAARGIDVEGVTHVINFELPNEPESYVHRIGRTARAGQSGIAISFCELDERYYLRDIEKTIRQSVPVEYDHPFHSEEIANDPGTKKKSPQRQGQRQGQGRGQGQGQRQGRGQAAGKGENQSRRRNSQRSRRPARMAA
ncbi:MAG: DEAD/DEAH box helicase [Rhodospirillaceae bacterium]|nr:DEAD/DEAH box helicase [Rhodospirillaceae bacterium]